MSRALVLAASELIGRRDQRGDGTDNDGAHADRAHRFSAPDAPPVRPRRRPRRRLRRDAVRPLRRPSRLGRARVAARRRRRRGRSRRCVVLRPARRRRRPPRRPGDAGPGAGAAGRGPVRPRRPDLAGLRARVPHPPPVRRAARPRPVAAAPAEPSAPRRRRHRLPRAAVVAAVVDDHHLRVGDQPSSYGDLLDGLGLVRALLWTGGYPLVGWIGFVLVGLWLARRGWATGWYR